MASGVAAGRAFIGRARARQRCSVPVRQLFTSLELLSLAKNNRCQGRPRSLSLLLRGRGEWRWLGQPLWCRSVVHSPKVTLPPTNAMDKHREGGTVMGSGWQ